MSFEGRYQYICKNGHYGESCVYTFNDKCDTCNCGLKETNLVDDTNEPGEGFDYKMEKRAKEMTTWDGCKIVARFKV